MKNEENWPLYIDKTKESNPRDFVEKTLEFFNLEKFKGKAVDIGCGAGNDINLMLENGWNVMGIDSESHSKNVCEERFKNNPNFSFQLQDFKSIEITNCDWVNASFSLPFCPKIDLKLLIDKIHQNLSKNGRFSGNFFGDRHSWTQLSLYSKEEVLEILSNFEIEFFTEIEEPRVSAFGEATDFHAFIFIVKFKNG
jgi:SAM-dependent methyltransferase